MRHCKRNMVYFAMLGVFLLAGCSKDVGSGGDDSHDRLIRLSAGLRAVSKAPVNPGMSFTAAVGGWQSMGAANYATAETWLSTASVTASESAGALTLSPQQYYSQNGAEKTYMKAWYPQGTLADNGKVDFKGSAGYKGDGTDDILLAPEVSGSALDAAIRTLAFKHLTTQLRFTVQGDALFGETTKIKTITIKDAGVPTGLDLSTDALVYEVKALAVPGAEGTAILSATATAAGDAVMVRPFGAKIFSIDVTTLDEQQKEVTYRDVAVTVSDDDTLPGKAYTIVLSFAGFEITAQASVTEWDYTGTGSGDVTTD